jgi:hypothetical protein
MSSLLWTPLRPLSFVADFTLRDELVPTATRVPQKPAELRPRECCCRTGTGGPDSQLCEGCPVLGF